MIVFLQLILKKIKKIYGFIRFNLLCKIKKYILNSKFINFLIFLYFSITYFNLKLLLHSIKIISNLLKIYKKK